jgi:hypothetical protein
MVLIRKIECTRDAPKGHQHLLVAESADHRKAPSGDTMRRLLLSVQANDWSDSAIQGDRGTVPELRRFLVFSTAAVSSLLNLCDLEHVVGPNLQGGEIRVCSVRTGFCGPIVRQPRSPAPSHPRRGSKWCCTLRPIAHLSRGSK